MKPKETGCPELFRNRIARKWKNETPQRKIAGKNADSFATNLYSKSDFRTIIKPQTKREQKKSSQTAIANRCEKRDSDDCCYDTASYDFTVCRHDSGTYVRPFSELWGRIRLSGILILFLNKSWKSCILLLIYKSWNLSIILFFSLSESQLSSL